MDAVSISDKSDSGDESIAVIDDKSDSGDESIAVIDDKSDSGDESIVVIDDESDERHMLTCGDDLPNITEFQDVIDNDNPIQYTREQLLFNVLNTITYNASLSSRNKWLRLANQYVDLFLRTQSSRYSNVMPVIHGKHTLVVSEEDFEELRRDPDAEFSYITMKSLLNQKSSSGSVSIKEHVQRMYKVDRTFSPLSVDDQETAITIKLAVKNTTPALLYQSLLTSGYSKNDHPNCTVFQPTLLYEGDTIVVSGFAFMQSDAPLMFDTNAYRSSLQSLTPGDDVAVMTSARDDPIATRVASSVGGILVTESGHSVYTNDVWKNTVFVYKSNSAHETPMYSKRIGVTKGVIFTLLPDDPDGSLTMQALLPSPNDLLQMFGDSLYSVVDARRLLSEYGMSLDDLDSDGLQILQSVLRDNVAHINSDANTNVTAPSRRGGLMTKEVRDLTRYGYAPYDAHGAAYDTIYNRMRYYMGQGDDGMIYMLSSVSGSVKRLEKDISQSLPKTEENIDEDEDDLQPSCPSRILKTYASLDAMFDDDDVDQFREGDMVQVVSGPTTKYFKRFKKHDGSLVWAKDYTHITSACSDIVPLSYAELIKTDCVFDDYDKVCRTMASLHRDNLRNNITRKRKMVEQAKSFLEGKAHTAKALKLEMHASRVGDRVGRFQTSFNMTADFTSDYSDFVGIAAVDFENQYGFADADQGGRVEDVNATQPRNQEEQTGDTYIDSFVSATGLSLPLVARQLMAKQLAAAFPQQDLPAKLEQLRAAVHKKIGIYIRDKLAKAKSAKDREQLILQANKLEEQTFQKKRKELLDSQGVSSERKVIAACALFVIVATIHVENVNFEFVIPKCKPALLKSGVVEYIYTAFQYLAESKASEFQFLPLTNIKKHIQDNITAILDSNIQLALAFSRKSKQLELRTRASPESTVWPSFRPLMGKDKTHQKIKGAEGSESKSRKHQSLPTVTKYNTNAGLRNFDMLFMSKPIHVDVKMVQESQPRRVDNIQGSTPLLPVLLRDLASTTRQTAQFWDGFSEITLGKFDTIFSKLELDDAIVASFVKSFLKVHVDKISFVSNVLRNFVISNLLSILGRLANNWRVEDTQKSTQDELELIDIVLDITDIPTIKQHLNQSTDLVHASLALEQSKSIYSQVHRLYYWLLVLVETLYLMCAPIRSNTSSSGFGEVIKSPLKHYTVISHLVSYILKSCVNTLQLNTFVVKDLQHAQEAIREKGKEKIIEKLEHLEDDKQIFIEAKKVGLFTWDDIPVRFHDHEEDAITFRGNDEDNEDYDEDNFVRRENEDGVES